MEYDRRGLLMEEKNDWMKIVYVIDWGNDKKRK